MNSGYYFLTNLSCILKELIWLCLKVPKKKLIWVKFVVCRCLRTYIWSQHLTSNSYWHQHYFYLISLTPLQYVFQALRNLYTNLTPIQRVQIARHPNRPTFLDHVFNITEKVCFSLDLSLFLALRMVQVSQTMPFYAFIVQFVELHGDRAGYDDPAIVTGLGTINGKSYMFMGHQKGRNTKENIKRNFGMPTPHGYVY